MLVLAALSVMPVIILAWQKPAPAVIGWRSSSRSRTRRVLSAAADTAAAPCFWFEEPVETRRVTAPFGRAQQGVDERLQALNWQQRRHEQGPSFTFNYPGAPTFCAYHPDTPAPIRQIPTSWDDHVDDKLRLHLLLSAASAALSGMTPSTFVVNHALLASLDEAGQDQEMEGRWFLKHRLDAKRPRVHPFSSSAELCERLRQMGEGSWKYFIAQKEIYPPMLIHGRKFVMRAHVLAWVRGDTIRLFLHSNPLVSEHEAPFEAGDRASPPALVLQSGSRSAAYLLSEALPALRASILEQMGSTAAAVFRELHTQHPLAPQHSKYSIGESLYQLYGLDFMLNSTGQVFLLEVNRSPRIATGAMGGVHGCYTELLMEAMQILGVTQTSTEASGEFGVWRDIYQATL